jgi:hypothetical protein
MELGGTDAVWGTPAAAQTAANCFDMPAFDRCCRKRFFWQVNQIFQHRRCMLRAPM